MFQQAMSRSITEITEAIVNIFAGQWVQFPRTQHIKNEIKGKFINFPGVIGVIDGTHIEIIRPIQEEHAYLNRKGYHSKNIQVICDADLRVLNVNAQHAGASHDSHIWRNSSVGRELEMAYQLGDHNSWLLGKKLKTHKIFLTNFNQINFFLRRFWIPSRAMANDANRKCCSWYSRISLYTISHKCKKLC